MDLSFAYTFPSIRGVQARRPFYISMCPLRLIPRIFSFDEEELSPELRAQRVLNKARIPEMARYILDNRNDYVFSSLTASLDAEVAFEPAKGDDSGRIGDLHIPMDARFIINDGQHRRAAIEAALRENPKLGDEHISVVFFLDRGLERCQQMFADLNRYAIRPSPSLTVLYDHRDNLAALTRQVVFTSPMFKDLVELERSTLSARARKLFTLSALYTANKELLINYQGKPFEEAFDVAHGYWEEVAKLFPQWRSVRDHKLSSGELRRDYIHSHAVVLHSLGRAGRNLIERHAHGWKKKLTALKKLDWARKNASTWEGRAMIGGRVTKSAQNVTLTTNVIKRTLGLELTPDEQALEEAYEEGSRHGQG